MWPDQVHEDNPVGREHWNLLAAIGNLQGQATFTEFLTGRY